MELGFDAAWLWRFAIAFMASPGHRANILSTNYMYAGIGFALIDLGNGLTLVYEVQEFAAV